MEWLRKKVKDKDYKGFIGDASKYDAIGDKVFNVLLDNGLSKRDFVLDYGCGSLRVGKKLIPHLYKDKYFGYDPNSWLIKEALKKEIDSDIIDSKNPNLTSNFDDIEQSFDVIFAHSVFVHASKNEIIDVLNKFKRILKGEGVIIFNFIQGIDNEKKEWSYPQGVKYSMETITGILDDIGYKYEEINKGDIHKWIKAS